ncbi:MAG: phenylalanine--tRNA ligase subunit beta, partial [Actinomycetota bacterium]
MRVPLSWLAEYVDLPAESTPETVMEQLVKVGLEEEAAHFFDVSGPVVVGQVLEFQEEPQSNGKTIRWCQVQVAPTGAKAADGGADVRGIVCGASNFEVGDKVVVCLPGAVLPGNFVISARSTYGHVSDGMMASGRELNLSEDHDGILRLGTMGLDPKIGSDAIELLGLQDSALEISVLPDRAYCLSIRGIAREYSHATSSDYRDPTGNAHPVHGEGFGLNVVDENPIRGRKTSQSFILRSVTGIDATKPTPAWMRARLKLAGMRSISLAVDITNYVMLELGQPVHAYDLDKIKGDFLIRRAKKGETLKTLDGQVRKLDPEDLLITDGSGPIGLAGVMGGESTEVSETTKNVLIEAAHFDSISIARSARRHKLFSEASKRYERGVDPKVGEFAAARVIQLLEVHAGGTAGLLGASYSDFDEPNAIFLPASFASELTGVEYSQEQIEKVLNEIGANFNLADGGYEVFPPSWRSDLRHKTDLVEEIARIIGYDQIPSRIPVAPPGRGLTRSQTLRRSVLNALAASGLTEVLSYPFVSEAQLSWFSNQEAVKLANPMQEESGWLRTSLIPGLIETARRNLSRGLTDLALMESGSVFLAPKAKLKTFPETADRPTDAELAELGKTIPEQPRRIAGLFLGNRLAQQPGLRSASYGVEDALMALRVIASATGSEIEIKQSTPKGFHPNRSGEILIAGKIIGLVGELDPALSKANDLPRTVAIFELDLDQLISLSPEVLKATQLGTLPAATQDLSLVVAQEISAGEVLAAVREGAGELLEAISLTDDYRGENIPAGTKSLTFALRFRA